MDGEGDLAAARERMIARRFGGKQSRTGGKGTARRKRKAAHKTASSDDKKLTSTLKKLGLTTIPGIEEVNMFKSNSSEVIHFVNPKVQASIGANTYVVSGTSEVKQITELIPGIINQLGPENIQAITAQMGGAGGAGMMPMPSVQEQDEADGEEDEDEDVPDLEDIDDFEAVANQEA